jgi:hypothetical protein
MLIDQETDASHRLVIAVPKMVDAAEAIDFQTSATFAVLSDNATVSVKYAVGMRMGVLQKVPNTAEIDSASLGP